MTTPELLSMMRLLSAMESAMLTAGKSLPDHIWDDVGRHVEILEREILERTKPMTDKPTDEALENLFVEETGFDPDDFPAAIFDFARAVLAKWGQPAQAAEPFCWHWENTFNGGTGTVKKNPETLGINMSHPDYKWTALYTAPQPTQTQPVAREPLTDEQIQDLLLCGNPTDEEMRLIRIGWDAARGIKGGQHGTE